jgi:membrane-bound serine protease (ClpP class)
MAGIAAVVTNPNIGPFILMIGIAFVVIEVLTVGLGIAGFIGGGCLVLYFAGHYYAGQTGWSAILLFIAGILLIVIEACIPGFGVPGVCGILCFISSIILMAPTVQAGVQSILIALFGSIIIIAIALRFLGRSKYWDRLSLSQSLSKDEGYISQNEDYSVYIGRKGKALTALRPAGIVALDDGKKLDEVSDGEFIEKGKAVLITAVDGPKILAVRAEDL